MDSEHGRSHQDMNQAGWLMSCGFMLHCLLVKQSKRHNAIGRPHASLVSLKMGVHFILFMKGRREAETSRPFWTFSQEKKGAKGPQGVLAALRKRGNVLQELCGAISCAPALASNQLRVH